MVRIFKTETGTSTEGVQRYSARVKTVAVQSRTETGSDAIGNSVLQVYSVKFFKKSAP